MFKNEITNQSNEQKKILSKGSRNKFVKGLCLAALVLMVSKMVLAEEITLESQLNKIAALSSIQVAGNKNLLGIATIGLILVLCKWWLKYCRPVTRDKAEQINQEDASACSKYTCTTKESTNNNNNNKESN